MTETKTLRTIHEKPYPLDLDQPVVCYAVRGYPKWSYSIVQILYQDSRDRKLLRRMQHLGPIPGDGRWVRQRSTQVSRVSVSSHAGPALQPVSY